MKAQRASSLLLPLPHIAEVAPDISRDDKLRAALLKVCRGLRECFHRSGRLSSRHEALDELAKLIFAHVMSMSEGGAGITLDPAGKMSAQRLREFVTDMVSRFLPVSLTHEMKATDFHLRLRDSEDDLAREIATCFGALEERDLVMQIRGRDAVDVLNDAFGQFIADSFVDEKELGQYLTPNEVIRFMVRLGLAALDSDTRAALTDPKRQHSAGLILDPSCGVGTFLTETLRLLYASVTDTQGEIQATKWAANAIRHNVIGVDKSERMLRLALTNLALFGTHEVNLHLANALARAGEHGRLMRSYEGRARLILTNPPFGATFDADALSSYQLATTWATKAPRAIDSELLFFERYVDWLAPGGHLVAIVPDSVLTNHAIFQDLRDGILPQVELRTIVSLPSVTFGVAGTSTKTSIVHIRKRDGRQHGDGRTLFAVCKDIGYEVQTRDSTRSKVRSGKNELDEILPQAIARQEGPLTRLVTITSKDARWDATFHAGLPASVSRRLIANATASVRVRDVAKLANDRVNPTRMGSEQTFRYIEIADVDAFSCTVRAKTVLCSEAPSRARKVVHKGDILVSTVRPERRAVAVVHGELDGAVCSTGFAVLRTTLAPLVLARLLQSDFVNAQMVRDNSGIAYPAIEEDTLLDLVLPISIADATALAKVADVAIRAREEAERHAQTFGDALSRVVSCWIGTT